MNKKIFIINGSGGVGKDTFVKYISNIIPTTNYSSVDKVKEIAKYIGWTGGKTEKDRKFLSDLKLLTTEYNNMPFNDMKSLVDDFNNGLLNTDLLFLHIREPEEIEIAKIQFNAKTILVKNDNVKDITSNMADGNVHNYIYDYYIDNSYSLDILQETANAFIKEVISETNVERGI